MTSLLTNFFCSEIQVAPFSFIERGLAYVVITDDTVCNFLTPAVKKWIGDYPIIVMPSKEVHKTRETKAYLEDELARLHMGKDTLILAIGGGVVLDVAGFVAATYCRGIPWYAIPTTLLAMVDASLGGKTAVNTPFIKNGIGSFHPPEKILLDMAFLNTLPKEEYLGGLAEVIKYGLTFDSTLLSELDREPLNLVKRSLAIKQGIVSQDPLDQGIRRALNFGHTFAHGIEKVSNYEISHGFAVARGLVMEAFLSYRMGYLSVDDFCKIKDLIDAKGYLSFSLDKESILKAILGDKKTRAQKCRCVLIESIGKIIPFDGEYCCEVPGKLLEEALFYL